MPFVVVQLTRSPGSPLAPPDSDPPGPGGPLQIDKKKVIWMQTEFSCHDIPKLDHSAVAHSLSFFSRISLLSPHTV